MEKMTKKEMFAEVIAMATKEGREDIVAFAEKEIVALDNKALKAKERAAKKRAEGDALMDAVRAALTAEPQLIASIASTIPVAEGEDEVSVSKVQYRLTQLVKAGEAVKAEVTVESADGKKSKRMAYSLA